MSNLKTGISAFLLAASVLMENALSDPEIKTALERYGVSDDKLLAAKKLYDETVALQHLQKRKYGQQVQATAELRNVWKLAEQQYMKTLKIARTAFQEIAKAEKAAVLHGIRKQSLSEWLVEAQLFYANILGDSELLHALSGYGYSPEKLRQEAALIAAVGKKSMEQKRAMGEAQEATKARDEKIAQLAKRISDLKAVARVAMAEEPQQLEKLGMVVKGKG
jgi:hypothetical protein